MKFKHILLATSALLTVGVLASCSGGGGMKPVKEFDWFEGHTGDAPAPALEGSQGTKAQRETAVAMAAAKTLAYNSRATGMLPNKVTEFSGNDNQYLYLVTKQTVKAGGENIVVDIKWTYGAYDEAGQKAIKGMRYFWDDKTHAVIDFDYEGLTSASTVWVKAEVVCGDTSVTQSGGADLTYFAQLGPKTLIHDVVQIPDLYKLNDAGTCFNIVDEAEDWYKPNYDQEYYYVKVQGKVNYCSPDGNWGLISNGDQVIEIYAGSGTPFTEANYPALSKGYVEVTGNMGIYNGNMQVGFVTGIKALSDHSHIKEPTGWGSATEDALNSVTQFTERWMNGFFKAEGTYAGNIKDSDGKAVSDPTQLKDKRFTFDVKVGNKTLTIAYDYHVDRDVTEQNPGKGIFNAYKALLASKKVGDSMKVAGTMRFVSTKGNFTNTGAFQLTPFLKDHLA